MKNKKKQKSIILRGNLAIQNPNYVQKLQLHSTPRVELGLMSI